LARACRDYDLPVRRLSPDAASQLLARPWPGNVRDLANVIERAVLFSDGEVITTAALVGTQTIGGVVDPSAPSPEADASGQGIADQAMTAFDPQRLLNALGGLPRLSGGVFGRSPVG
jgi:DNA-binding NtrC family response regulator